MLRRTLPFILLSLVVLSCSGCVQETQNGDSQTFSYQLWLPLSVLLGGIVAAPAGWFMRSQKHGWTILILGPVAALFFAPTLLLERTTLAGDTYTVRSGIWGMTASHELDISKVKQVTITVEERRGRRGRKSKSTYYICQNEDGSTTKLSVNNDVTRAGAAHLVAALEKRGVPVYDQRQ